MISYSIFVLLSFYHTSERWLKAGNKLDMIKALIRSFRSKIPRREDDSNPAGTNAT
jgi:hypothetical protein